LKRNTPCKKAGSHPIIGVKWNGGVCKMLVIGGTGQKLRGEGRVLARRKKLSLRRTKLHLRKNVGSGVSKRTKKIQTYLKRRSPKNRQPVKNWPLRESAEGKGFGQQKETFRSAVNPGRGTARVTGGKTASGKKEKQKKNTKSTKGERCRPQHETRGGEKNWGGSGKGLKTFREALKKGDRRGTNLLTNGRGQNASASTKHQIQA